MNYREHEEFILKKRQYLKMRTKRRRIALAVLLSALVIVWLMIFITLNKFGKLDEQSRISQSAFESTEIHSQKE